MALDLPITLLIVAYIVIGFIAWQILKKIIGVVITLSVFTLILMLAFGFFVYKDILDMKANVKSGTTVVLYEDKALAGFRVADEATLMTKEHLFQATQYIENKDFDELLGTSYKLFIMHPMAIESLEDPQFILEDDTLTKEQALIVLRSNDPISVVEGYGISTPASAEEIKSDLLAQGFEQGIKNPVFMISQIKEGNLQVHPNTALFKAMKYIPLAFIESAVKKVAQESKEAASDITAKVVATVNTD